MDKAISKYLHWFASYPSLVLFVCSILSLLMLGYCEPLLNEMIGPGNMPGLSKLILTRIPSYLCAAASEYFAESIEPASVVWSYSGVRPLYDDGTRAAQEATRSFQTCHGPGERSISRIRRQTHSSNSPPTSNTGSSSRKQSDSWSSARNARQGAQLFRCSSNRSAMFSARIPSRESDTSSLT